MTGIPARERLHPTQPMQPGQVERREFDYIRHGTQTLIASFAVATGEVLAPVVGQTRTEADFATHIGAVVDHVPAATWIFVADNLNTHQSETLVRFVAVRRGLADDLGVKGQSGILNTHFRRAVLVACGRSPDTPLSFPGVLSTCAHRRDFAGEMG
jgi:hypothetical protein